MSHNLWRDSSPADLDSLEYEQWRDERRHSRLAQAALSVLPKDVAADADWIEVMMISGAIWQFQYDPNLPGSQPLTRLQPQVIARLANHYGLDEQDILNALNLPESLPVAASAIHSCTPGRLSASALRRWHDAILAAVPMGDQPDAHGDLKSYSLGAAHYLAETRTAAYLWVKNHPEHARRLLADKEYLAMLPTPPAVLAESYGPLDISNWTEQLRAEAITSQNCIPAALEWLTAPPINNCAPKATEQQTRLAEWVAALLPLDRR